MESHPHKRRSLWTRLRPESARKAGWKVSVPIACACVGLLATTSMINARGTDLRGGRHTDLPGIVSAQSEEVQDLRAESVRLQDDVDRLTQQLSGGRVDRLQRQLDEIAAPAGMQGVKGPGLTVTLDDAPLDQAIAEEVDPNWLVVHQQDIQAVINAMWAGGAEAISLQGQRIISTTGIKCVGNTVRLHDVPYAPPYEIAAVGDTERMYDALVASPEVSNYRVFTQPPYNLGWSLQSANSLKVPAYTGPLDMEFAQPAELPS